MSRSKDQKGNLPAMGPWLTARDAVRYLGFSSLGALYVAVHRDQLPAHRLGRRLRFLTTELDSYIMTRIDD